MKIYNSYKRLPRNYTLVTDDYEYKMAQGYLKTNKQNEIAVFDIFFRKIPNGGGYAIMAGLDKIIEYIKDIKFTESNFDYFRRNGYDEEFIDYLKNFKFTGDVYAVPDGTPVFPNEPLITIKAPLIESQIIETSLLAIINGAMEHATAARRIVEATPNGKSIMEFGGRRADGLEAAIDSSIYALMAGCNGTSNVLAADMLNKKALGTMAHSWIESFDSEFDAFISFARIYPNNCILLVDTYDTLRSGIPNAINTFNYMKENNMPLDNIGIRIDSGNLVNLSKEARKMLQQAGFPQAKICLSNGLTAENIENLVAEGAEFDMLGVGDNISKPDGRMGCVYKEVAIDTFESNLRPKIKLSNDAIKITNPGYKKLYRAYDKNTNLAICDVIERAGFSISKDDLIIIDPSNPINKTEIKDFELVELQKTIFKQGKLVYKDNDLDIDDVKHYCNSQMSTIYDDVKRTTNPANYYVSSPLEYFEYKSQIIDEERAKVKKIRMDV